MILRIYAVRDKAVSTFLTPFFMRSDGEAHRSFQDVVLEVGHAFNKHPEDFSLWRIGVFDDATGNVDSLDSAELLVQAMTIASSVVSSR